MSNQESQPEKKPTPKAIAYKREKAREAIQAETDVRLMTTANIDELKFIAKYLEDGNPVEAARHVRGDLPYHTLYAWGSNIIKRHPDIIEAVATKHDITMSRIMKGYSEGMNATKPVLVGSGEDKSIEMIPDYAVRKQYLDQAMKILGFKLDDDVKANLIQQNFTQNNVTMNADSEEAKDIAQQFAEFVKDKTKVKDT